MRYDTNRACERPRFGFSSFSARQIFDTITMATDAAASAAEAPIALAAADQDINPWSVQGGVDENGEVVAIDYKAISKYDETFLDREIL